MNENGAELSADVADAGDRSIPLIAVQYPALPMGMVKQIVGDDAGVTFVDNEATFLQAIKDPPAREIYRNLFAGIFGHMTLHGYGLLAENVARGVRGLLADQQRQPDAIPAS